MSDNNNDYCDVELDFYDDLYDDYENDELDDVDLDSSEEFKRYYNTAKQADAEAQYKVGCFYRDGKGVHQDYVKARTWFCRAVELGHKQAAREMKYAYLNGIGGLRDERSADIFHRKVLEFEYMDSISMWLRTAEHANVEIQRNLGFEYLNGKYLKQNNKEALRWFAKDAEQGDVESQYRTGRLLRGYDDVKLNFASVKWYRMAAEQGHLKAKSELAEFLWNGDFIKQDYAEAVELFHVVAKNGDDVAQCYMGRAYYLGIIVEQELTLCTFGHPRQCSKNNPGWLYRQE